MARYGVDGRATFEQDDRTRFNGKVCAGQKAVVDALLAIAHREFRIGREQERRVGVMRAVIAHVAHARFLVRAENEAQRVRQPRRLARLLQRAPQVHGVQRHHARALVVDDAAPDQIPVLARDGERLEMPARTRRHHVHVADDTQLRVRFAGEIGVANIAFVVVRFEAHAFCQVKCRRQRRTRPGAVRCAFGGRAAVLEAGNAHQRIDVGDNLFPMRIKIFLNALFKQRFCGHLNLRAFVFHGVSPFLVVRSAMFRYNARATCPSGGMADAAVSKTVVSRRASSTLASGTIQNQRPRTRGAVFVFQAYSCHWRMAPSTSTRRTVVPLPSSLSASRRVPGPK